MPVLIPPASVGSPGGGSGVSSFNGRVGTVVPQVGDYSAFYASLASPALTGTPTAPTAAPGTNTTQLATTAYTDAAVTVETTRATNVEVLKAPLASPALTGTPTAPTAAVDTNTTRIATTAFVLAQAASAVPLIDGTAATGTSTRFARGDHVHPTDTTRAPLASPALTGTPTAPTVVSSSDSTTKIATTAFVQAALAGFGGTVTSVNGHTGAVTLTVTDVGAIPVSAEGAVNGVATLDSAAQVPASQLANAPGGGGSALPPGYALNVLQFGPLGTAAQDGHYPKTAGGTQTVGDGSGTQLSAVYTTLGAAQVVYAFATALTQTVDFCAIQAGLNALGVKQHGTLHVPAGSYQMGNPNTSCLRFPFVSGQGLVALVGDNPFYAWPGYGGATNLAWSAGTDATGAPHFTYAIDATPTARPAIVGIAMKGPTIFANNSGVLPCVLAGIRVGSESLIEKVGLENFSTGVGYGGGTSGGWASDKGFDHSTINQLWTDNVGYSIHLLPGSITSGDQRFYAIETHASLAGLAIAASASSGFAGCNITGGGLYGAIGVYMYDDGSGGTGLQFSGNELQNVSFELCFNAAIYSQLYKTGGATASGIVEKNHIAYLPNIALPSLNGWGGDFVVQSSGFGGANPNQVTLVDGSGVMFQVGMAATGLDVPANTTVTAIAGSWPWSTVTLTLSNNLTADPAAPHTTLTTALSGSVFTVNVAALPAAIPSGTNVIVTSGANTQLLTTTSSASAGATSFTVVPATMNATYPIGSTVQVSLNVVQPKLGNIVANQISNNVFPTFSSAVRSLPVYVAGSHGAFNNTCSDADHTLAGARNAPLTSGISYGNTWGQPGSTSFIGSSQMTGGQSCAAGDLLMWDAGNKTVKKSDGTRPLAGAAILAAAAGANVDFYIEAQSPNNATVHNYSGTLIAANALLKLDLVNPAGVTTATNLADGPIVGVNNASSIAGGASGTVDRFKVPA